MTHPGLEPRPRNPESRALNIKRPPGALKGTDGGVKKQMFYHFTPMGCQERISPYNVNTISRRQVMRTQKNINSEIIS